MPTRRGQRATREGRASILNGPDYRTKGGGEEAWYDAWQR